jgi:hypothetical protein
MGTIGSVASLLATTIFQGNPDRIHKLWNIGSTEGYILDMQALLACSYEIISIFPLGTFHLYVATFQQRLHIEYISLS